jgi:hypothetical protein
MDLEAFHAGHRLRANRRAKTAECACGQPLPWVGIGMAYDQHLLEQAWYAGVCFGALAEADAAAEARARAEACVCNIGVQPCPVHPGNLRTIDERFAFERAWDAAFRRSQRGTS